jgi:hypothetical protein
MAFKTINRSEILSALGASGNDNAIRTYDNGFGVHFDSLREMALFFTALGISGGYVDGRGEYGGIDSDDARLLANAASFDLDGDGGCHVDWPGIELES